MILPVDKAGNPARRNSILQRSLYFSAYKIQVQYRVSTVNRRPVMDKRVTCRHNRSIIVSRRESIIAVRVPESESRGPVEKARKKRDLGLEKIRNRALRRTIAYNTQHTTSKIVRNES